MRSLSFGTVLFLSAAALAQPPQSSQVPQELPALERSIAHAFSQARSMAHLRPLGRIQNRPALRQIVCASAADDRAHEKQLAQESEADGALVQLHTTSPEIATLPSDLRRVAEYDDRHSARGRRITRFSVAAFAVPQPAGTLAEPWVGVTLYWSRSTEFIALHFTQSFYPQDLRGGVPAACLALR